MASLEKSNKWSFIKLYEQYEPKVLKWGAIILAAILAGSLFALEVLHVIPESVKPEIAEKAISSIAFVVALIVVRQLFATAGEVEKISEKVNNLEGKIPIDLRDAEDRVSHKVEDLGSKISKESKAVVASLAPKLYRLSDCVELIKEEAEDRNLYPIETLVIDWLGLDMGSAWNYLRDDVLKDSRIRKIQLRVLMISPTWKQNGLPDDILKWQENSQFNLGRIERWFDEERDHCLARGREIIVDIGLYHHLPSVHGFQIKRPVSAIYLSFCRWSGRKYQDYDWGESKYRRIIGEPNSLDSTTRDLAKIFIGQFEHLWASAETEKLKKETKASA